MNKHTPGPWHIGGRHKCTTYDAYGQRVSDSFEGVMVTQRSDAECQANARLIAAAPELLEALVLLLKYSARPSCETLHHDKKDRHHGLEPCPAEVRLYQARIMAEDAIAKAKGETP